MFSLFSGSVSIDIRLSSDNESLIFIVTDSKSIASSSVLIRFVGLFISNFGESYNEPRKNDGKDKRKSTTHQKYIFMEDVE